MSREEHKDAIEVSIIFHEGQRMFAVPKHPAPAQEPVAWLDLNKLSDKNMVYATGFKVSDKQSALCLCTPPAQPAPVALTEGVTVPMAVLEAAEASLGSFCSDLGWSDEDMQNMDNLSAYIARHKANLGITKGQP
jgi:hypothetical protein